MLTSCNLDRCNGFSNCSMPHHIIWDGWSFDLLYQEMASLYPASLAQRPAPLPAPTVSYLDFAHWHAQWMDSEECENQITFWKQRFGRVDILRPLPTDRPRSGGMSGVGAAEWVHVDEALTEQLRHTARACDATLNMLVMAIYAAMLSEALGSRSLVLGIPLLAAMGLLKFMPKMLDGRVQLRNLLEISAAMSAVVALANKNARILWAVMTREKRYEAHHISSIPIPASATAPALVSAM